MATYHIISIVFLVISAIFWVAAALKGFHKLKFVTTPPAEAMGGQW